MQRLRILYNRWALSKGSQRVFVLKPLFKLLVLIIFVGSIASAIYFYNQYRKVTGSDSKAEVKQLLDDVSKIMELPSDEVPTVAAVTDKSKLQDQPFFHNAQNGDKVIIYLKAQKAILYRPTIHKIIDVAPIRANGDTTTAAPSAADTAVSPPQIALYNGTDTVGATSKVEKQITDQVANAKITKKANAKANYDKTIIVDVTGKYTAVAQDLGTAIGAELSPLPTGEAKPATDILVIVGKDKVQ